jgi:formate dehydrogenase
VLPTPSALERPDLLFAFPLLFGQQSVPYLQATAAVTAPPAGAMPEMEIYLRLARAAGIPLFGSRLLQGLLQAGLRAGLLTERRVLSAVLRAGGQGSFDELLAHPHGRLREPLEPGSFLGQRVATADGKVRLAPPALLEALRSLPPPEELGAAAPSMAPPRSRSSRRAVAGEDKGTDRGADEGEGRSGETFQLISKREVRTHNSWTHNASALVPRGETATHLYLHPKDAARLGLESNDLADVTSAVATVRLPVRLDPDLGRKVAAIPHGWGHQGALGQRVARRAGGVNVNLLTPDGPAALERPSGMARLTALPVGVAPAAGPLDRQSWSGVGPDTAPGKDPGKGPGGGSDEVRESGAEPGAGAGGPGEGAPGEGAPGATAESPA